MTRMVRSRRWMARAVWNLRRWPRTRRIRGRVTKFLSVRYDTIPPNVTPFVVLATARSGSTLLMERLASNWKSIRSDGETFNPKIKRDLNFDGAMSRTYFTDTGHAFVGSKIIHSQVSDSELESILQGRGMRVVILRRDNLIRQFVSLQIAKKDRVWQQSATSERSDVSSRAVHIDANDLLEYQSFLAEVYKGFATHTAGMPVAEVTYEGLMDDLDPTIRRIGEFLGAGHPDRSVPTRLLRQNPEPLRELIVNFDELRRTLSAGGHSTLVAFLDS